MSNHRQSPVPWTLERGEGPVVATAIHSGHSLRPAIARRMGLSDSERLHEEDPYTGEWTKIADSRTVFHRSRFEVDLNRDLDCSVYREPEDCWDLPVRSSPLPDEEIAESQRLHETFYRELGSLLTEIQQRCGRFVLLDLHTYNHRRGGPHAPPEPQSENPDVNVGTASVDRGAWGGVIDRFMADMSGFEVGSSALDVRENVKFVGAHLVRWVNANFPGSAALAIEVKKIFMDEHTGELDPVAWKETHRALEAAAAGCRQELHR